MDEFTFNAIGTTWCIFTDATPLQDDAKKAVLEYIAGFDKRFSRFLADSEANAFRSAEAGGYTISKELAILLSEAQRLRYLTDGVYDPAVGGLLERAGYDATYSMRSLDNVDEFVLPKWTVAGETLTLDGPAVFDIGGTGKGYCIDQVAALLGRFGYKHFLVDAGGDMYATYKEDGSAWRVAIQYPGKPDTAASVVNLKNQGIAVSDSFRRRWGVWHHVVHPQFKSPIEHIIGAAAVAPNAWHADCMTSALFLSSSKKYPSIAREYKAGYLVFNNEGTCIVSSDWQGELF